MFCSNKIDPKNYAINWQIWKEKNIICKYYNQNIHDMSFSLPTFAIRDIVETKRLGSHFLIDADGIKFDLLNDKWSLNKDTSVNYIGKFIKD